MSNTVEIVTVDSANVDEYGFFCYKSKPKAEGYRRKLDWLRQRLAEGMKLKILYENERSVGFIEYTPGEHAWRAVNAPGYSVMHCLWIVGKAKRKGYASRLLSEWLEDARNMGMLGAAAVTSSRVWLVGSKVLLKHGFEAVDQAPPTFELLVRKFGDAPTPAFPQNWDARLGRYSPDLTIVRADQCPYIENAVKSALRTAGELGTPAEVVELRSAREVQELAPSAYGVFSIVYDGRLLSYHYLAEKELRKRLREHQR